MVKKHTTKRRGHFRRTKPMGLGLSTEDARKHFWMALQGSDGKGKGVIHRVF